MIEIINKNIITKFFVIKNGLLVITLPDKDVLYIGDKNSNLTGYLNIHSKNIFNRIIKFGAILFRSMPPSLSIVRGSRRTSL